MSPIDPFTGEEIPPGVPTVTCPHGHVNRLDSWKEGNRCHFPNCSYVGDPAPLMNASQNVPTSSGQSVPPSVHRRRHQPPTSSPDNPRRWGWIFFATIFTVILGVTLFNANINTRPPATPTLGIISATLEDPTTFPLTPHQKSPTPSRTTKPSRTPRPTYTPRPTSTSSSPNVANLPTSCPGAPPIRVRIDDLARVTYTDGRPLRLRSAPRISSANIIARLPEGEKIKIRYGPVCANSYAFWQVKVKSTGVIGWVAEGNNQNYFIETVRR